MTKQNADDPGMVAASPVVHEPGLLQYRIVIRGLGDRHVVHTQVQGDPAPGLRSRLG